MPRLSAALIGRLSFVVALVMAPRVAAAQNLLLNPHFDTGTSGWGGIGLSFDPTQDAGGSPSSGSGLETITLPNVGPGINQCVAVAAGASYDFGGSIRPTTLSNGGGAGFAVAFFQSGACSGIGTGGPVTPLVTTTGTFTPVSATAVAPPLSLSALIVGGFTTSGNFQANFDDMFFQPSATVPAMPSWLLCVLAALTVAGGAIALRSPASRRAAIPRR